MRRTFVTGKERFSVGAATKLSEREEEEFFFSTAIDDILLSSSTLFSILFVGREFIIYIKRNKNLDAI